MYLCNRYKIEAYKQHTENALSIPYPTVACVWTHRPQGSTYGWRGGLVVGRRTCDLVVAGSRPGRDAAAQQPSRQVVHTLLLLSPSSIVWYQRKLGGKQAYRVVHQPVSRGLTVFADAWLSGWLVEISADLRETVAH